MNYITAYIDLKALKHNLNEIKKLVPNKKIIAVVKADAYGHGVERIAKTLESEVFGFAVARVPEAIHLREIGIKKDIVLLEGFYSQDELEAIYEYNLITAVHDELQAQLIETLNHPEHKIKCFLKINIGMHRLGVNQENIQSLRQRLEKSKNVELPLGLISHLSVADTPSQEQFNDEQISYFNDIAKSFDGPLCLANSAGILSWPKCHTEYVRPGIILYGISPYEDLTARDHNLQPVMTLKSKLLLIRDVKKGDKIGYGAAFEVKEDTKIGIVAAGYGDGYPRTAPHGTPVYINGRMVYTAGNVCMDMFFIDLGANSTDKIGDEVTLWGKNLPVETIAKRCGTIPYELVCRVMPRVTKLFIE